MNLELLRQGLGAAFTGVLALLAVYTLARRRSLGPVLVRLGWYGPHRVTALAGLGMLTLGILEWVLLRRLDLIALSGGAGLVFFGLIPLELRARGIASRDNAYAWSRLIDWRWVDADRSQLELRVRTALPRGRTVVPIAVGHRDRVEDVLAAHANVPRV